MFFLLDFVYVLTEDVDEGARLYVELLGAELVWKVPHGHHRRLPARRGAGPQLHELAIPQGACDLQRLADSDSLSTS